MKKHLVTVALILAAFGAGFVVGQTFSYTAKEVGAVDRYSYSVGYMRGRLTESEYADPDERQITQTIACRFYKSDHMDRYPKGYTPTAIDRSLYDLCNQTEDSTPIQ